MMRKLYVIAGEPSGDFLGAKVLSRLVKISDLEIHGIGGDLMKASGLCSLFDIREISVGGLLEVIPHIIKIKKLISKTVEDIIQNNPQILLTIDSPGFCFRVAKKIKRMAPNIKLVHLVAPSVWAWRQGRAAKIAKLYDKLLTLFDFEPQYFTKYGMDTVFVGHPAVEEYYFNYKEKEDTLLILPGSRHQEIKSLLPIFIEAANNISISRVVIPTLPHLESEIQAIVGNNKIEIQSNEIEKQKLFQTSKTAIVASGTATLQLALSGCPMVVCYKLSNISYKIVKSMVKVRFISLVNLILNYNVVPELIQDECNSENISKTLMNIDIHYQTKQFQNIRAKLTPGGKLPSEEIANQVLKMF